MTATFASTRAKDHSHVLTVLQSFLVATPCDGIDALGIPTQAQTPTHQYLLIASRQ
jgi:hypothetical protein